MTFPGFSLPDGAWIPPELIYMLARLTEAGLKILLIVIYQNLQIGGGEPVSLTDFEHLTGLSRTSIKNTLQDLIHDGLIERERIGRSYAYKPAINTRIGQNLPYRIVNKLRESDSKLINSLSDSLNSDGANSGPIEPDGPEFIQLVRELRSAGVYLKTAQALIAQHDAKTIRQHLEYYRFALDKKFAQGPGWLVLSLKESWPAPLGWIDHQALFSYPVSVADPEETEDEDGESILPIPENRVTAVQDASLFLPISGRMTPAMAWKVARQQMLLDLPKNAFEKYFDHADLTYYDPTGVLTIATTDDYAREWLEKRLSSTLTRLFCGILNRSVSLRFIT